MQIPLPHIIKNAVILRSEETQRQKLNNPI
jgi:hypothetical protein